jgi:3',5'-cyclic AMP phosphodiesterase CpdA
MKINTSFSRPLLIFCSLVISFTAVADTQKPNASQAPLQIAFMPDIHFHDVYADFQDDSFAGIPNKISGKNATIRTMQSQIMSTRLFNENYFALLAALDDVAGRGIKLVALPGDFSDDGQPIHIRGLRKILDTYSKEHDIEFFAAPGNHDPVRPFDTPGGKADFLGTSGKPQAIFSKATPQCATDKVTVIEGKQSRTRPTICTDEIRYLGYQSIMSELGNFGFYPKAHYQYWETPYSDDQSYDFARAVKQADFRNRHYEICREGTGGRFKKTDYTQCTQVPDASYLVEPVPGLWLLAIDANVYLPSDKHPQHFEGSGNAGYNKMLTHKTHVLEWISDVVKRAKNSDKQLIAFSHFPMTEFYDGQSGAIADLFGEKSFQLERQPQQHVSQVLADMGLKVHVGGHMHFNDTGVVRSPSGHTLFNIQAPSLAAYMPAYKVMTLHANQQVEIETVVLNEVPRFSELFEHYREEHKALRKAGAPAWDKRILQSQNYRTFTDWHIRELTRQRFLPQEWPKNLKHMLLSLNGQEMLILTQLQENSAREFLKSNQPQQFDVDGLKRTVQWQVAENSAKKLVKKAGLKLNSFASWTGFDLAVDFYRLRNAGQLALPDIDGERLAHYRLLSKSAALQQTAENLQDMLLTERLVQLLAILDAFQNDEPDDHFMLDLNSGKVRKLPQ